MKALTTATPSLDLLPCNHHQRLPRIAQLGSQAFFAPLQRRDQNQRRLGYGFCLALSFNNNNKSISPIPISASAQANADECNATQAMSMTPGGGVSNTNTNTNIVRVKFKLVRECIFGQQFLVVGEDEALGAWDASAGLPLTWHMGHLWTAEVDLPASKLIKFKFVLKGPGVTSWQPGPDRTFRTWRSTKKISVYEDWLNPEYQNIAEEDLASDPDSNHLVVTEPKITSPMDQGSTEEGNGVAIPEEEEPLALPVITDNNITTNFSSSSDKENAQTTVNLTPENNGAAASAGKELVCSDGKRVVVASEEVPVLVPGLSATRGEDQGEIAEPEIAQAENNSILDNAATEIGVMTEKLEYDYASASASPYPNPPPPPPPGHANGNATEQETYEKEEANIIMIVERDVQWGKRTLLKLLSTLGLQ
ncbi:uncharacterized protein LOC127248952 [Andrographis paniculata]|uniref:uncharacterized protein LOC127248952 n=1 Tax=Andrographis paniculata TaxID=175694 RepID=UPI0021E77214|nr:uncharacterized protein LOC127248952 [Andrographis paniculata]